MPEMRQTAVSLTVQGAAPGGRAKSQARPQNTAVKETEAEAKRDRER